MIDKIVKISAHVVMAAVRLRISVQQLAVASVELSRLAVAWDSQVRLLLAWAIFVGIRAVQAADDDGAEKPSHSFLFTLVSAGVVETNAAISLVSHHVLHVMSTPSWLSPQQPHSSHH